MSDDASQLDTMPVFSSSNHNAEMEALSIRGLLESNGIDCVLVGPSTIPSLEFQVQVPKAQFEDAQRVIAEAKAAGPSAAAEAERNSENPV